MTRRLHRFPVGVLAAGELRLRGDGAHYLKNVLRLKAGDALELFDGRGGSAPAQVTSLDGADLVVEVGARTVAQAPHPLTVAVATPKGERADWTVEKLTEVGVERVLWVQCERSVVKPRSGGQREQRWRRVAEAAARQAGRDRVPDIDGPVPLASLWDLEFELKLVGSADGAQIGALWPNSGPRSAILLIGPEGGLTDHELAGAADAGYNTVRLGPYTMRVETAALVGAGLVVGQLDAQERNR